MYLWIRVMYPYSSHIVYPKCMNNHHMTIVSFVIWWLYHLSYGDCIIRYMKYASLQCIIVRVISITFIPSSSDLCCTEFTQKYSIKISFLHTSSDDVEVKSCICFLLCYINRYYCYFERGGHYSLASVGRHDLRIKVQNKAINEICQLSKLLLNIMHIYSYPSKNRYKHYASR